MRARGAKLSAAVLSALMAINTAPASALAASPQGPDVTVSGVPVDAGVINVFSVVVNKVYYDENGALKADVSFERTDGDQAADPDARYDETVDASEYELITKEDCVNDRVVRIQFEIDKAVFTSDPTTVDGTATDHHMVEEIRNVTAATCHTPAEVEHYFYCDNEGCDYNYSTITQGETLDHVYAGYVINEDAPSFNITFENGFPELIDPQFNGWYTMTDWCVLCNEEHANPDKQVVINLTEGTQLDSFIITQDLDWHFLSEADMNTSLDPSQNWWDAYPHETVWLRNCEEDGYYYQAHYNAVDAAGNPGLDFLNLRSNLLAAVKVDVPAGHTWGDTYIDENSISPVGNLEIVPDENGAYLLWDGTRVSVSNKSCKDSVSFDLVHDCINPNDGGTYDVSTVVLEPSSVHGAIGDWEEVEEKRVRHCTSDGAGDVIDYYYEKHCLVCDALIDSKIETSDLMDHVAGIPVMENEIPSTCGTSGSYDSVKYCIYEGHTELTRVKILTAPTGEHVYGEPYIVWESDLVVDEMAAPGDDNTQYAPIAHVEAVCTICGGHGETFRNVPYTGIWTANIPGWDITAGDIISDYIGCKAAQREYTATYVFDGTEKNATDKYPVAKADTVVEDTKVHDYFESVADYEARTPHIAAPAVQENVVDATCTTEGSYDRVVYCEVCGDEISRTTKVIEALGHTPAEAVEENVVDATCTTDGSYDLVVYCEVCGEELSREAQVIEALGHTAAEAVVENEVDATCTTDGSYDLVVYCEVCGEELSREAQVVEAFGHTSDDGVITKEPTPGEPGIKTYTCTVCGEVLSTEEVAYEKNGLVKFEDGNWYYLVDGEVDSSHTGLVKFNGVWFYVQHGVLNREYKGLVKCFNAWFYVENGMINSSYTGLVKFNGVWFYVNKGVVDYTYDGLVKFNGVWFYVNNGMLDRTYDGLVKFNGVWFYVSNGMINRDYVGLVKFNGVWFYVANGMIDRSYSGPVMFNGVKLQVVNGIYSK